MRFRFLLLAGEATPGGSLAPPLAPFGLDLPRVAREINDRTVAHYQKGTPVVVRLQVVPPKGWRLQVAPPPLSSLYRAVGPLPSRAQLYALLLLYQREHRLSSPSRAAAQLFGFLRSRSPRPSL